MGKLKRAREKFHIASARLAAAATTASEEPKDIQGLPIKDWPVKSNIFDGIDINFDLVKKSLVEDDKVSVRSIAKSCKYDKNGKLLTKLEKRKLKHALLLTKIDALEQMKKEASRKRKKRKSVKKSDQEDVKMDLKLEENDEPDLPSKSKDKNSGKILKKKGTKKAKERKKELLDGVKAFKKILNSSSFKANPQKIITDSIHKIALS